MYNADSELTPEQYRKGKLLLDQLKELPEAEAIDLLRKTVVLAANMAVTFDRMERRDSKGN